MKTDGPLARRHADLRELPRKSVTLEVTLEHVTAHGADALIHALKDLLEGWQVDFKIRELP